MPTEQETKEVIKRLKREGWEERRGKGSHLIFRKDGKMINVSTFKKKSSRLARTEILRKWLAVALGWHRKDRET